MNVQYIDLDASDWTRFDRSVLITDITRIHKVLDIVLINFNILKLNTKCGKVLNSLNKHSNILKRH